MSELQRLERVLVEAGTEAFSGSKYTVLAPDGAVVLYAREDSAVVDRVLAGRSRAFQIDVFDTQHREVIKLRRPHMVGLDKMEVFVRGTPTPAATVREEVTFFKTVLSINDSADRPVIRVKGPVSASGQCDFELFSAEKERIGAISKRWSGHSQRPRGRAREGGSFSICFPRDLEVCYKAAVIGTCFLIDFLVYDN